MALRGATPDELKGHIAADIRKWNGVGRGQESSRSN